jgi:hypothetical protein
MPRVRARAIGLTVLAHAVVLLLLVWLERRAPQRDAPELQYVSIWPDVRSEPPPAPARMKATPVPRTSRPQTMPVTPASPALRQQEDRTDPAGQSAQSAIDWNAAVADAAARFAGSGGPTFSPAPQVMRKPCKSRKFAAETERLMEERLPRPVDPDSVGPNLTANCIVVGGFPKCVQKLGAGIAGTGGGRRASAGDLFKDRLAGKQPASSVPAPDVCD